MMKNDLWFTASIGFFFGVAFCILLSTFQDISRKAGCEQAVNENCVRVGWIAENQFEELKKMQNIKHPNGSPEQ